MHFLHDTDKSVFPQIPDSLKGKRIRLKDDLYFIGGNYELSERKMQNYLLEFRDPLIETNVRKAKRLRKWQPIGFGAIPCAVFTAGALYMDSQFPSYLKPDPEKFNLKEGAAISGALTACFITTTLVIKLNRVNRNAAAINRYNDQFLK